MKKLLPLLALLLLVSLAVASPIINPGSTGFGGQNRSDNVKNLTQTWLNYGPNISQIVTVGGVPIVAVPWQSRGDQCLLTQNSNGLHACQNTGSPFSNAQLSNETFCVVTDEASQKMQADALGSQNGTLMDYWVNTLNAYQSCGQAGNLTEWTVGIRMISVNNWEFNCSQVADSASDADAHFIVGLRAINTSIYANSSTRARAGNLVAAMCLGLADENFLRYNITSKINPGENISYLPCGGDDVCTNPSNSAFMYTAYNGPILEALAACQSYYGSDTLRNWTKLADSVVQAHLQASNWTGTSFSIGMGRSYRWVNHSGVGTAFAQCDVSCTPLAYTDDPDGMRAPRICQGGYVWSEYRNTTLRNLTTYCQQWHNLAGETGTTHVIERYFNSSARSSTSDGGYKAMGLGAFMNSLVNTSLADDRIDQYNSHIGMINGKITMDSQACFGIYDKAFGILAANFLIGNAEATFTGGSGGGGTPASSNASGINITLNNPLNGSTVTGTSVMLNATVYNLNNTDVAGGGGSSAWATIYDINMTTNPCTNGWTCGTGWYWNTTALVYNGSNFAGNLFTPDLDLAANFTNGYNLTYNVTTTNTSLFKIHYMTDSGELDNCKFHLRFVTNTTHDIQRDCGAFSDTGDWNNGVEARLDVFVNVTANTTIACRTAAGTTSCTSSAGAELGDLGDYSAWQGATTNSNSVLTITRFTLTAVTGGGGGSVAGNSTMNVSFQWANGTTIYQQNATANASTVTYNATGLAEGTYTWQVVARSKDNLVNLTSLTFTMSNPTPAPSACSFSNNTIPFLNYNHGAFWNETAEQGTPSGNGWYDHLGPPNSTATSYSTSWAANGTHSVALGYEGFAQGGNNLTGVLFPNDGNYNFTFKWNVSTTPTNGYATLFGLSNRTQADSQGCNEGTLNSLCLGWYTGNATHWSLHSNETQQSTVPITPGVHTVEFRVMNFGTVSVYVDGQNVGNKTGLSNLLHLSYYQRYGSTPKILVDDLNLWIGEPCTILTLGLSDEVRGVSLSEFCVQITSTNTTTPSEYACTTTGTVQTSTTFTSGNISFVNITNGTGSAAWFNVTTTNANFTTPKTITGLTWQGILLLNASQLYTNATISTFNATNGQVTNTTTTGTLTLKASNGTNTITARVLGNFSQQRTLSATPFVSTRYNLTGFYDTLFVLRARSGTFFENWTLNASNASVINNSQHTTTNGTIEFPALRGYSWFFVAQASGVSNANTTLTGNAEVTYYNFTLFPSQSIILTFYNESTNTQITNGTIYLELISDVYSNNYTTSNGTLNLSLVIPANYTFRYWIDPDVPREYYATLDPASYLDLDLYIIDEHVSNFYTAVVQSQSLIPLGGATVSLLRAYIVSNNVYQYEVVEMAKTDTNGQAVLRVQPNIINYKLLITYANRSTTTQPTKFTESTNTYTLSLVDNPLTSLAHLPSVTQSLTYNNATQTYVFTWSDPSLIVTRGCLTVTKYNTTGTYTATNTCASGATGSLIYTITDTNNTRYSASARLETNTEFSTYTFGPLSVDFRGTDEIFGLTGFIIFIIVIGTLALLSLETGTDSMIITSLLGMVLLGVFGFITYHWEAYIGIIIIGIILIYKTKS